MVIFLLLRDTLLCHHRWSPSYCFPQSVDFPTCRWCPKKGYSFCPGHHWWGGTAEPKALVLFKVDWPHLLSRAARPKTAAAMARAVLRRVTRSTCWQKEIHVSYFSPLFLQPRLGFGTKPEFSNIPSWGTKSWWKHRTLFNGILPVQNFAHPPYLAFRCCLVEGQRRGRQDQGEHVACNDFRHPDSQFLWFIEASN